MSAVFCLRDTNKYSYVKNLQGDVIAILNAMGGTVVEYKYDAWGNILSVTGSMSATLGAINPFRYRGCYYDTEPASTTCNPVTMTRRWEDF